MKTRNYALYYRVSALRQADVLDGSLDSQESRLKSWVKFEDSNSNDEWKIAGVYREEGRSGKDLRRPKFQRMKYDIENGLVNTIIVTKIDRLTRSLKDFSSIWDEMKNKGVEIISLNERFDTTTAMTPNPKWTFKK